MKKVLIAVALLLIAVSTLSVIGKKHVSTEIIIDASAGEIWDVLVDFASYPQWNPFIREISGVPEQGTAITVAFHVAGQDPLVLTPIITSCKEHELLQWEGKLFVPGLFTGRHTFQLEKAGNAATRLIQKEDFSGILVPFFNYDSTIEGFAMMNSELKRRVEGKKQ
jgi:hypothetical protein